jgi:hypothetical protein
MPELDLEPRHIREKDEKSGRWLQKRPDYILCRVLSVVGVSVAGISIWLGVQEGYPLSIMAFPAIMAFAAGGAFILSLKSLNW